MSIVLKQALLSMTSGSSVTFLYLLISGYLDKFINPKYSNFIALIISATINFMLQTLTFYNKKSFNFFNMFYKYLIAEIIIISCSQLGVVYFLNNQKTYEKILPSFIKKHYNTVIRIIVASFIFLFISFPLRKGWVYV